jgi:uncharacterized membrane protein YdjX (TVP38/TMEM64 family)
MTDLPDAPDAPLRRRPIWRYLLILVIPALFVALIASGALKHLSLGALRDHREQLKHFVAAHPIASLGAYYGLYVLLVVACVPGPSVMSVAGGFLFGPLLGGAAALACLLSGAVVVFLACRTAFGDWAAHRAGAMVARIEAGFARDAFSYLLALRLMPVAPFFLVNIAAGLARIRLSAFVIATVIGAAPSAFIYAGLGAGLGEIFRRHAKLDAHLLTRPDIALPLTGLTVLALAPVAWRLWRSRQGRAPTPPTAV